MFDVIPISEAWGHADAKFAMTYWPWSLLSQKAPLPEKYLLGAPDAVFDNPFGQGSFGPEVRAEYIETYRDPARVHAICEEYRAAATLDIEHDKADRKESRRITCPMLHLWAAGGPLDTFYEQDGGALGIWRKWADNVQGQAIKGGHFFPEENPTETTELLTKFSVRLKGKRTSCKLMSIDIPSRYGRKSSRDATSMTIEEPVCLERIHALGEVRRVC